MNIVNPVVLFHRLPRTLFGLGLFLLLGCSIPSHPPIPSGAKQKAIRHIESVQDCDPTLKSFDNNRGLEIWTQECNVLLRFTEPDTTQMVWIESTTNFVDWPDRTTYIIDPGGVFLDRLVMKTNAFKFYRIRALLE